MEFGGPRGVDQPFHLLQDQARTGRDGRPYRSRYCSPASSQPEASEAVFSVVVIEEAPQLIGTTESSSVMAGGNMMRMVDQVEAGIDDLIFTLKVNGGMPEVEAALRAARRLLVRSHGG